MHLGYFHIFARGTGHKDLNSRRTHRARFSEVTINFVGCQFETLQRTLIFRSFGADALPNGLGLLTQFDKFLFAIHILHLPEDPVGIHFSKHKLGVIQQIDFSTSDGF